MSRIIYIKAGEEFIPEAVSFSHPSVAEEHYSSVQWEMQAETEAPVKIGTGKSLKYKIDKKYAGKKITFRGYIEKDSLSKYPDQRIVCFVEGDTQKIRIRDVKCSVDKASVGESVEFEVTRYDVDKKHVNESAKMSIKWDVKIDGEKSILADQNQDPCRGEKIKFTIPVSWSGKEVTVMPYLRSSTETVSVKINVFPAEEYIIVVGRQSHSSDWRRNLFASVIGSVVGPGSKLMFVHQALRRMNLNRDIKFTFLICTNGTYGIAKVLEYSKTQLKEIRNTVENLYHGIFIKVNSAEQIINYINTGDINNSENVTRTRKNKRIKQLLFYSHGIVGEISLGLAPAGVDWTEFSFEESEVKKLNPEAFDPEAHIYSFACRTGLGNSKIDKSIYINDKKDKNDPNNRYNLLSAQSLAWIMANQTKATVYAYICRTDYEETLYTNDELCFSDYMKMRNGNTQIKYSPARCGNKYDYLLDKTQPLSDEDNERWKQWKEIEKNMTYPDGAIFDPDGARHSVKGGLTPIGTPQDMKTFKSQ